MVLVMYDARTKLADQVVHEVRDQATRSATRSCADRAPQAPSFAPIITFDPTSRGSIAYRSLAVEVSGGAAQRAG